MDSSVERPHACQHCEKAFKDSLTLKRHTNVKHTREECHVCDNCGDVFYTKYKLNSHLASKHGINALLKCDKCYRFFMSEWSLMKHTRKCSPIPCPVCAKAFHSKWKLKNHVNGHLNNKCHVCDECGKDFLHTTTLVDHIEIVHQGKRPHQCESCSKTFTRKNSLRQHNMIHLGIKPFPCKLCEKKFREKVQLIKHLQAKHKIKAEDIKEHVVMIPKKEVVNKEDLENILKIIEEIKPVPEIGPFISTNKSDNFVSNESGNIYIKYEKSELSNRIVDFKSENSNTPVQLLPVDEDRSVVSSVLTSDFISKVKTESEEFGILAETAAELYEAQSVDSLEDYTIDDEDLKEFTFQNIQL